ncbi:hypothetical protein ACMT4L_06915 [Deinococcus sp. A31D244]|uniref:hypothetical protein n=1 Tax=Deinococcus sp. A31D244 TaxID=3397675 RepID=UPI0039E09152
MTVQRRRTSPQARQEVTQTLGSIRQQQRDARAHAERIYQAVRAWETSSNAGELVPSGGPRTGKTSRMQVVGIGQYGGPPCAVLFISRLHLPHGSVSERAAAEICNADPLLERVRAGGGLATLVQERGWHQHRADALAYAKAVLRLAAILGDSRADEALSIIHALDPANKSATLSVSSQE